MTRYAVVVETRPRERIADPEGATIERSLPALGFDGVSDVRVGKAFRFTVEMDNGPAVRRFVEDMCHRFLANPVIEDFEIIRLEHEEEPAS
jgi:phosphoribosylformylglycinamidine synthase subunit PurS